MTPTFPSRRMAWAVGLSVTAAAVLMLRTHDDAAARPRIPTSDSEVLEHLPTRGRDPRERELERLRLRLAATPTDLALAVEVARRNIDRSRSLSDPRYLGYAQAALAPWWDLPSPPPEVLVLRATIRQSTHDFEGALRDLDLLLSITPNDPQALITRSVVHAVRGEYEAARASCAPLPGLTSHLVAVICSASIDSLTGDAKGAEARLVSALAAPSPFMRRSDLETEWAMSTLGEIASRAGDPKEAERHFVEAMTLDPTDTYALAAWSDLLLDQDRAPEVAARLAGRESNDGLLLRLALAEAASHAKGTEEHVALLRARFEASHARGDVVHRREEARFVIRFEHDPPRALALATANWGVQREPWDARIYLEAAKAAKDPTAARPVIDWLDRTHLEDPVIAGLVASLRGER